MSDEILRAIGRLEGGFDEFRKGVNASVVEIKESVATHEKRVAKLEKNQARAAGMFAVIAAIGGFVVNFVAEKLRG